MPSSAIEHLVLRLEHNQGLIDTGIAQKMPMGPLTSRACSVKEQAVTGVREEENTSARGG